MNFTTDFLKKCVYLSYAFLGQAWHLVPFYILAYRCTLRDLNRVTGRRLEQQDPLSMLIITWGGLVFMDICLFLLATFGHTPQLLLLYYVACVNVFLECQWCDMTITAVVIVCVSIFRVSFAQLTSEYESDCIWALHSDFFARLVCWFFGKFTPNGYKFGYVIAKRLIGNIFVVLSQLNGNNGEWTGSDDVGSIDKAIADLSCTTGGSNKKSNPFGKVRDSGRQHLKAGGSSKATKGKRGFQFREHRRSEPQEKTKVQFLPGEGDDHQEEVIYFQPRQKSNFDNPFLILLRKIVGMLMNFPRIQKVMRVISNLMELLLDIWALNYLKTDHGGVFKNDVFSPQLAVNGDENVCFFSSNGYTHKQTHTVSKAGLTLLAGLHAGLKLNEHSVNTFCYTLRQNTAVGPVDPDTGKAKQLPAPIVGEIATYTALFYYQAQYRLAAIAAKGMRAAETGSYDRA